MIPNDDQNPYAPPVSEIGELENQGTTRSQSAIAIKASALMQAMLLVLGALILDGGNMFRAFAIAAAGSWIMTAFILGRRRRSPTSLDLILLRYGFLFCLFLVGILSRLVAR